MRWINHQDPSLLPSFALPQENDERNENSLHYGRRLLELGEKEEWLVEPSLVAFLILPNRIEASFGVRQCSGGGGFGIFGEGARAGRKHAQLR